MLSAIMQRLKSRTYRLALILAAISGIEASCGFLMDFFGIPAFARPWLVLVWPAAMLTMRELTTTALSDK